jgi:hypothetical protein
VGLLRLTKLKALVNSLRACKREPLLELKVAEQPQVDVFAQQRN